MKLKAIKQGKNLEIQENIDIPDGQEITIIISKMSFTNVKSVQNIFKLLLQLPSQFQQDILQEIENIDLLNIEIFMEEIETILLKYKYKWSEQQVINEIQLDSNLILESEEDILNLSIKLTE